MRVHRVLLLAYLVALVAYAAAQGSDNGGSSGNANLGSDNGGGNGNNNLGSGNGNTNGNSNTGSNNGIVNGNQNTGNQNGKQNGNNNYGSENGGYNGNNNLGSGNGGANGNNNAGSNNGVGNGNNNVGSGNGRGNGNGNAGGRGDPIFTGFAGRAWEFEGQPGKYYNLISERNHQISTKLKVGVMWDHNGTYMEGIALHYRSHKVVIEVDPTNTDSFTVSLDGTPLAIRPGQNELDHIVESEDVQALLTIHWHLHREDFGHSVELQTELVKLLVWVTPAGTFDEGGVEQPSYLNFDTTLLGAPLGNEMQGLVGETYARMLAGEAVEDPQHPLHQPDDFRHHGQHETAEYEMVGYFDEASPLSLLGKQLVAASRRRLIETARKVSFPIRGGAGRALAEVAKTGAAPVQFPLHASGRGLIRDPLAKASGGARGL